MASWWRDKRWTGRYGDRWATDRRWKGICNLAVQQIGDGQADVGLVGQLGDGQAKIVS